jgi:hypothetical protein
VADGVDGAVVVEARLGDALERPEVLAANGEVWRPKAARWNAEEVTEGRAGGLELYHQLRSRQGKELHMPLPMASELVPSGSDPSNEVWKGARRDAQHEEGRFHGVLIEERQDIVRGPRQRLFT